MPRKYALTAIVLTVALGFVNVGHAQTDLYAAPAIVPTLESAHVPSYTPPVSQTYPPVAMPPQAAVRPVAYPSQGYVNPAPAYPAPPQAAVRPVAYPSQGYANPAPAYPAAAPAYPYPSTAQAAGGPIQYNPRYAGAGYSAPSELAFNRPETTGQTASIPGIRPTSTHAAAGPPARPLKPLPGNAPGGNLTSQMLHESSSGATTYAFPNCGVYPQTQVGGCDTSCETQCAAPALPCVKPCCPWYGSIGALYMTRNSANRVWVSYEADDDTNQLMNTDDIGLAWRAGGEITFGRTFCCGAWGLEATYWALDAFTGNASVSHPDGVSTPLIVDYLDFFDPDPPYTEHDATEYFNGAGSHRLWRRDEVHNVEINFLCNQIYGSHDACSIPSSQIRWVLGLRYFRFEEGLMFASLDQGYSWWQDGGAHQAYIDENIKNNLWGLQTGVELEWGRHLNPYGLSIYVTPKIGIYGNYMENYFNIYRGDGIVATTTPHTGNYPLESNGGCVSFLGEIDAGIDWRFSDRWSARIGYRVVAISGIGLADHQIPTYVNDIPEIAHISRNGDLVLHGGYLGVTYNY